MQNLKSVSPELNRAITSLEKNKNINVYINTTSQFQKDHPKKAAKDNSWQYGATVKDGQNSSIYYNEDEGFLVDGNYSSSTAILAHELGHAENNMNGTSVMYNPDEAKKPNGNIQEKIKGNANERQSIFYDNQVRQKEGEPTRSYDYYKANKETNQ